MQVGAVHIIPLFHCGATGRGAAAVQIQTGGLVLDVVISGIRGRQLPFQVGAVYFGPLGHLRAGTGGTTTVNDQTGGAVLHEIISAGAWAGGIRGGVADFNAAARQVTVIEICRA